MYSRGKRKNKSQKNKKYISNISNEAFKKLARNNVKKSIKDYMIYFITLLFGVTLLYTFNSIDNNLSFLNDNRLLEPYINMARGVLGGFSIIICLIFGFLITYANNFIMKKRKREFGIYTSLGMDKRDINKLMFKETVIIGSLSLVLGLIVGIFASQGLSIITFKMLNIDSLSFKFSISMSGIIKTAILFILLLLFINKFNKKTIDKYKLIDLINSNKKNEGGMDKGKFSNIAKFIFSIVLMFGSYIGLSTGKLSTIKISICIILIVLATYLFFISISDFIVSCIKRRKKVYYKDLNMFVISQMSSRIKTMSSSVTIICLIITSALIIMPFGMSFANYFNNNLGKDTPYSATITKRIKNYDSEIYSNDEIFTNKKYNSLKADFMKYNLNYDKLFKSSNEIKIYILKDITISKIASKNDNYDGPMNLISLSDYNNARKQQGLDPIELEENGFAINCSYDDYKNIYENLIKNNNNKKININGHDLKLSQDKLYSITYQSSTMTRDIGSIIVNDRILNNLYPVVTYLNCDYIESNNEYDNKFLDAYYDFSEKYDDNEYSLSFESKLVIDGEKIAFNTIFAFISIYIGIVLLISAGAILALQQVSESAVNKERFNILRRLGAKENSMKKAIFKQVFIFFMIPLGLAILHSVFISKVLHEVALELSSSGIINNILITIVIMVIVYGSYFFASYFESLSIINDNK